LTRGTVILLCGPALAGKTSLARRLHARLGAVTVSLDEINARRGLHGGAGLSESQWTRTLQIAQAEAVAAMELGAAWLVVDDTNCYRFLRDAWRDLARRHGYDVALVVLEIAPAEIRARDHRVASGDDPTRRGVRPDVLATHLATFEWPDHHEAPVTLRIPGPDVDEWIASLGPEGGRGGG
jgi:predicted kinase